MTKVQVTARVEGLDRVRLGFQKFISTMEPVSVEKIEAAQTRAAKRAIPWRGGGSYDVPPRGDYVRTGELGESVRIVTEGPSVRIEVGADHARVVVGGADGTGQAQMHAGRWLLLRTAVDSEMDALTSGIESGLLRQAEAVGL